MLHGADSRCKALGLTSTDQMRFNEGVNGHVHRIEKRMGIPLSRSEMNDLLRTAAAVMEPLVARLCARGREDGCRARRRGRR